VHPSEKTFLEEELQLKHAPEPTNIIWENRHTTSKQILSRRILVGVAILALLVGMLAFFTYMKKFTVRNQKRYPPNTDCTSINQMFNVDGVVDFSTTGSYYNYATIDAPYTQNKEGTGIY